MKRKKIKKIFLKLFMAIFSRLLKVLGKGLLRGKPFFKRVFPLNRQDEIILINVMIF